MKTNAGKGHVLVSYNESRTAKIEDFSIRIAPKKKC